MKTTGFVLLILLVLVGTVGAVENASVLVQEPIRLFDQPVDADLYVLRPGDELKATFIDTKLRAIELIVDPQGRVVHPLLGVIDLGDLSLSEATTALQEAIKLKYSVDQIIISIGAVRQVSVYVTGAIAEPGLYRGYTNQRVSEIISDAGGVLPGGSTRGILFLRGDQQRTVDLDRATYAGDRKADLPLYAGTRIYVPGRGGELVNVIGEVNRPCEIELIEGDDLAVLLQIAGGLTGFGDPNGVVHKNVRGEIQAVGAALASGDVITVGPRSLGESETVSLRGAVQNPGRFELDNGMTLKQLIVAAGGPTENAATELTTIFRRSGLDEFGRLDIRRYPLIEGISAGAGTSVALKPADSVHVPYRVGYVEVEGEVVNPGRYPHTAGQRVGDYLGLAGGLLADDVTFEVEVYNRVSRLTMKRPMEAMVRDGDRLTIIVVQENR